MKVMCDVTIYDVRLKAKSDKYGRKLETTDPATAG